MFEKEDANGKIHLWLPQHVELAGSNVHVGCVLRESPGKRERNSYNTETNGPGEGHQTGLLNDASGTAGHHTTVIALTEMAPGPWKDEGRVNALSFLRDQGTVWWQAGRRAETPGVCSGSWWPREVTTEYLSSPFWPERL